MSSIAELARPADAAAVRELVREAGSLGTRLRIVGHGTWLDAGRPVAEAVPLHTAGLSGVVEYTPGDLTLTARAGTTLGEIARLTAAESQWLTLDPFGGDTGSIAATVATASAGPLAHSTGVPRDIVLGVEFVSGAGDIVRGGGRVVKNVAGFDLTRLVVGSWGTLGVLTEVTVRLRALPERDETFAIAAPDDAPGLVHLLERLRSSPFSPLALELVNGALARELGFEERAMLVARLAGNEEAVRAQHATLGAHGDTTSLPSTVWPRLRESEPSRAIVARLSTRPSRVADTWMAALSLAAVAGGGLVHATPARGVVRCMLPAQPAAATALAEARVDAARVFEKLPAGLWDALSPSAIDDRLSAGVRRAFDPHGVLNPGILGPVVR